MNIRQKTIFLTLAGLFLCSCQSNKAPEPDYALAVSSSGGVQRTKYVPVPMPGQLMSTKDDSPSGERLTGEDAIEEANKKAERQPNSGEYINSIMNFNFMPGALYQIYSAPLKVTDVQFQNNESIVSVGAGDTLRWQVSKTHSGVGANRQEHLLVKPSDEGLTNNLVVTTNLRTYHLMLHSTATTYMASVTWVYPDSDDGIVKNFDDDDSISSITDGVDVSKLNFNYQAKLTKGHKPSWYPSMIFNDGKKTYIKFPNDSQESPILFIGNEKTAQVVNYRTQGNYYVVDNVFYTAQLRGGPNNKTVIQITMRKK